MSAKASLGPPPPRLGGYEEISRNAIGGTPEHPISPDANVLYVGGSSLLDRGGTVVSNLTREIVKARREHGHKIVVGVGGGIRSQHVHMIADDLGLPTGLKALLAGGGEEQALRILVSLLLPAGGCPMNRDSPLNFALYLEQGLTPVVVASPLHHYWEPPARWEQHVDCGPDYGLVNLAEVLSARSMIFIKDVDGLCTKDPRASPDARLIPRIGINELLRQGPESMPIERSALEAFRRGHRLKELKIINGLKPETLIEALGGEQVGTVIFRDEENAP